MSRRDLAPSLVVLGAVVSFALVGLAADGNGWKALRVGSASAAYAAVLAAWLALANGATAPPWRLFALGGGLAGLVGGFVRPEFDVRLTAASAAAEPSFWAARTGSPSARGAACGGA